MWIIIGIYSTPSLPIMLWQDSKYHWTYQHYIFHCFLLHLPQVCSWQEKHVYTDISVMHNCLQVPHLGLKQKESSTTSICSIKHCSTLWQVLSNNNLFLDNEAKMVISKYFESWAKFCTYIESSHGNARCLFLSEYKSSKSMVGTNEYSCCASMCNAIEN